MSAIGQRLVGWFAGSPRTGSAAVPVRAAGYSRAGAPSRVQGFDQALLWVTVALLAFGLVMVYSASVAMPDNPKFARYRHDHFLVRHAAFIALAFVVSVFTFQVPVATWEKVAPWLFIASLMLLILVLIPHLGKGVNGARRWLVLGFMSFQPSELAKFAVLLYAANYMVRKMDVKERFFRAVLPMAAAVAVVGMLLLAEPDMGAFMVIAVIAMGILFLGGMNWRLFAGLIVMLLIGFVMLIWLSPYRMQRVVGFMDPWADPYGKGYQLSHALIAFGRGEWLGVGLGASVEKLFYLPEAHTDFLLAVIAEELGFAGVLVIIVLFAWLVARGFTIGRRAAALDRPFQSLVAQGIGLWIGVQAIINMGVNMGVLPTKGLTLPLLSFGGSAIAATCVAIGILLRVDWENRQAMRGVKV